MSAEIQDEFEALFNSFIGQFSEGDDVPEGAYEIYCREHGSSELLAYLHKCDIMNAEAAKHDCRY